jgi:AraC-like DNA-binding protein
VSFEASESVAAVRHLIRTAGRYGVALDEGPTACEPVFSSRIAPAAAERLWARAAHALGPSLPLVVAASPDDHTSLMLLAAMACRTIGEALQLTVARWRYITDAFAVRLVHTDGDVELRLERSERSGAPAPLSPALSPPLPPLGARVATEYLLASLVRGGAWLSGGAWRPAAIVLGHRPPIALERWAAACGAPVRVELGAPGLVIAAESLALPVRGGLSRAAGRCFLELLDWYTPRQRAAGSVAERVTAALARDLSAVAPTVDQLAAELALSSRSLHRQLAAEGTSYQRLLDGLRCDAAIRQTLEEQRPFKAIAAAVGFADPRAFRRAFKRWTGSTPQAFRLRRLGGAGPLSSVSESSS